MKLCGDPTCESPGCDSAVLEEWIARQQYEAKKLVRPWAVTEQEQRRFEGENR